MLLAVKSRLEEVGYDLEQFVTDGYAGEVSRTVMTPYFARGEYGPGLLEGVTRVITRIAEGRGVTFTGVPQVAPSRGPDIQLSPWLIIAIIIFIVLMNNAGGRRSRLRRGSRWGAGPWSGGTAGSARWRERGWRRGFGGGLGIWRRACGWWRRGSGRAVGSGFSPREGESDYGDNTRRIVTSAFVAESLALSAVPTTVGRGRASSAWAKCRIKTAPQRSHSNLVEPVKLASNERKVSQLQSRAPSCRRSTTADATPQPTTEPALARLLVIAEGTNLDANDSSIAVDELAGTRSIAVERMRYNERVRVQYHRASFPA